MKCFQCEICSGVRDEKAAWLEFHSCATLYVNKPLSSSEMPVNIVI